MPSVDYDLRFLQAGLDELESYLLSNEIYWPINATAPPGEAAYPQLTLGTLLLVQKRLEMTAKAPGHSAIFTRLAAQADRLRTRWRTAWGKKAAAEFRARLNLWRNFIDDYRKEPAAHYDRYAYEVSRRVTLELLSQEAYDLPAAQTGLLEQLDLILRASLHQSDFIWDTALSESFPDETYWYLYGKLESADTPNIHS